MLTGLRRQREIDGTKMKLSKGIVLLFLGLFFKVAVADIPRIFTQVYWLELEIESSVYENFSALLKDQTLTNITNAFVTDITITTDCTLYGKHNKNCSCRPGYTWSEDTCKNYDGCDHNRMQVDDIALCLSESKVSINGLTTFNESQCTVLCDPSKKGSKEYKEQNTQITAQLVGNYSTLKYFDSLIINSYRSGSIIVDYTVELMGSVQLTELENVINTLGNSKLVTTGLITVTGPQGPIDIGSSTTITCSTLPKLKNVIGLENVKWFLTGGQNKTTEITTGKEAYLKYGSNDTVELYNISGSWKGSIKCVYKKGFIEHTGSAVLDIALLPEIQAMSKPQFPDCRDANANVEVEIECTILDDKENYNVTWQCPSDCSVEQTKDLGTFVSYKVKAHIYCGTKQEIVNFTCIFTNDRAKNNTNRSQTVEIPIIYSHSKFCDKDREWPITKDNYAAIISCGNSAIGTQMRNCINAEWKNPIPSCVNMDLHGVQKAVEELLKGIGFIQNDADKLFKQIQESSTVQTFNSFANINASVAIFFTMNEVSKMQSNQWNDTIIPDFVKSISNALNNTSSWKNPETENTDLSLKYLKVIENTIKNSNLTLKDPQNANNVELAVCSNSKGTLCGAFNASVIADSKVVVVGFRNLHNIFPKYNESDNLETTIVSVTTANNATKSNSTSVVLNFDYGDKRLSNHKMYCVFWNENENAWSSEGCEWGGAGNPRMCTCKHNSAFTMLMSKTAETLPYITELTYAGLGISIASLVLCLIIEFLVWDTVVKSDITNFRHVALVNICLCLLFAHCGFLVSANPQAISSQWCSFLAVVKHFFFLAVFFWMLCLSLVLLHQMIFVFDQLRKKVFLALSITVGYVCPIICVATTYITFKNGTEGEYYSRDNGCWLVYGGVLQGSIFSFVIPALTIVMVNLFTLVVVIMKIVTPTVSESKARDQKDVARSMIKTVVFLSPVLGLTWLLGILVLYLDLTQEPYAQIVGYSFTLLNSLQGFLILLTNCLGEKKVFDALQKRFQSKPSVQSKTQISTKATPSSMAN